ncbi:hypothetical protein [Sabulicella rubraurantiaca]|uniref:hypothetical protein n=1 Tax=Sabulicella rubraurantiaca TaxID=2811429 RepID=UPI001A9755AE|nr:hypothetical protein [Sabulicella rubraurantiaca]
MNSPQLETVCEAVELVQGVGDPLLGQFCVMSLVACLAGEGHTDRPRCASAVIRALAIPVNDRMPPEARQRLKVFVPRILGTNDGLDGLRAAILCRAILEEVVPKTLFEAGRERAKGRERGFFWRLWTRRAKRVLIGEITAARAKLLAEGEQSTPFELKERVAEAAGHLITLCAADAPTADDEEWYWNKAIDLLDRLCDIGADERAAEPQAPPLMALSITLTSRLSEGDAPRKPAVAPSYLTLLFR